MIIILKPNLSFDWFGYSPPINLTLRDKRPTAAAIWYFAPFGRVSENTKWLYFNVELRVIVLLSLDFPAIVNASLCFGKNEEVVITISSPILQSTGSI